MYKYEDNDIATFYFVIREDKIKHQKGVQAWTDEKDLAEYYLRFHNCPDFKLKDVTNKIEEINKILNENIHDEIGIYNITIRNPDKPRKTKNIFIPATNNEMTFVNGECNSFVSSRVNYSFLNSAIPYLKDKYAKCMKNIFLTCIIDSEIHGKDIPILRDFKFDQLKMLYRSFPGNFG